MLGAIAWRWIWCPLSPDSPWQTRWESALSAFCLPPLMVLLAAVAVIAMGHHGTMMGQSVSPVGCWVSWGGLALASGVLTYSLGCAVRTGWQLRQYPVVALPEGGQARCLPVDLPLAAQVGLWRSALLVSRGWLEQLTTEEQQATLAHEQAHADYRDPFWFLWLGLVRRFSIWLPHTEALWEELLLLRELRADQRATATSDSLLLAELLVKLSRQITLASHLEVYLEDGVGFNDGRSLSRLEQRVNALLEPPPLPERSVSLWLRQVIGLMVATLPLAATWLHT
jgi:Zn-dependent protease with chaperone function